MNYQAVLTFWFETIDEKQWWTKDPVFDQTLADQFGLLHQQASQCELFAWRDKPEGALAEIIVLDQFSRNIYRGQAQAFAYDSLALALAQEAIAKQHDTALTDIQRSFLYMPFMHSESLAIHEYALQLFGAINRLEYEIKHKTIIERFGRYPHRNALLGRESTPEEIEFLAGPGSSF